MRIISPVLASILILTTTSVAQVQGEWSQFSLTESVDPLTDEVSWRVSATRRQDFQPEMTTAFLCFPERGNEAMEILLEDGQIHFELSDFLRV